MKKNNFENLAKDVEQSPEKLLKNLMASFGKYGIQNVECRIEQGEFIIEQKLGEGMKGLGYDKNGKSLWLCLDQINPETIADNEKWNANTLINIESNLPGIKIISDKGKIKLEIEKDHPAITLAQMFKKENNIFLPGEFNNWQLNNNFELNEKTGKWEIDIKNWDGNIAQCKIAISDLEADWNAGKWEEGAIQKMKVNL